MIETLFYVISKKTNPSYNQGLERYLLDNVADNAAILLLWQDEDTVMLGRKQKAWEVCQVEHLADDNGELGRRLADSSAVYSSRDCLNVSLITDRENYDPQMMTGIVADACRQLGIETKNDPKKGLQTEDGKMIILRDLYTHKLNFESIHIAKCCDHGVLMLQNNLAEAKKYIKEQESLERIGRTAGLKGLCPGLSADRLEAALLRAFVDAADVGAEQLALIPAASIRAAGGRFHDDSAISDRDFRMEIEFFEDPGWFMDEA